MNLSQVVYAHQGQVVYAAWGGNKQTVLQHLREQRRMTGTKEGCAEGDCGACLILVAEFHPDGQGVRYRSANSCFMPLSALHGRLLITVESIGKPDSLHPVQQAMVDQHASQCGFCTPGFVVGLYEHYLHNASASSTDAVHQQLSGNLCRCTGYAPILRAAQSMFDMPRVERDIAADAALLHRLATLSEVTGAQLQNGGEVAFFPKNSDGVASELQRHPEAVILGGSTDVGLWITKQLRSLKKVIHLSRALDLQQAKRSDDGLRIGAAMPIADAFSLLNDDYPELAELWSRFASPPVRHVATLGGNLANGSPIGDSMPALMALGVRITLRRGDQWRDVPIEDFYLGYQRTVINAGEFIEYIHVPARRDELFLRAYKVSKRFDDDISALSLALGLTMDGKRITGVQIAMGGMASTPKRAFHTEAAILGRLLDVQTMVDAAPALTQDFSPISDHRASADYRLKVAGNLLVRAALEFKGVKHARVIRIEGAIA